jgi:uncharacterized protein YidB (DUF937 family)
VDAGKPTGGGLGDLLGGLFGGGPGITKPGGSLGGLGGLLGGAAAGGVLSGGLGNLIRDLQNSGHGRAVQSWIGSGPNEAITPNNLEAALGSDTIDAISKQTGMGRDELLAMLTKHLPGFIDQLTPEGRLPTEAEASQMVWHASGEGAAGQRWRLAGNTLRTEKMLRLRIAGFGGANSQECFRKHRVGNFRAWRFG